MGIAKASAELASLLGNHFSQSKADLAAHGQSESYFAPSRIFRFWDGCALARVGGVILIDFEMLDAQL